jgi:acyl carrier protein
MNPQSIQDKVLLIISEILGVPLNKVFLLSNLSADLDADEFDIIEIVRELEGEFDIVFTDEDIEKIKSVFGFIQVTERELKIKSGVQNS